MTFFQWMRSAGTIRSAFNKKLNNASPTLLISMQSNDETTFTLYKFIMMNYKKQKTERQITFIKTLISKISYITVPIEAYRLLFARFPEWQCGRRVIIAEKQCGIAAKFLGSILCHVNSFPML